MSRETEDAKAYNEHLRLLIARAREPKSSIASTESLAMVWQAENRLARDLANALERALVQLDEKKR